MSCNVNAQTMNRYFTDPRSGFTCSTFVGTKDLSPGCAGLCWQNKYGVRENVQKDSICREDVPECSSSQWSCQDVGDAVLAFTCNQPTEEACNSQQDQCFWRPAPPPAPPPPSPPAPSPPPSPPPPSPPPSPPPPSPPPSPPPPSPPPAPVPGPGPDKYYTCEGPKCIVDPHGNEYKNDPTCGGGCKNNNNTIIIIIVITLIVMTLGSVGIYYFFGRQK